nr:BRCT domain-containing protein [Gammaproteobacteria bacterium]
MLTERSSRRELEVQDRLIDELIGICRGVIADDNVDEREAIFLGQWIENHRDIANRWPVNVLYARITEMLKDGVLSKDEQGELLRTLQELTGESSTYQEPNRSTTLPINRPAPDIEFAGKTFCLTGQFVFGSKIECEETVAELGGMVDQAPTQDTDYLVIGEVCSPEWEHTSFGKSIEVAVEMQRKGPEIKI